MPTKVDIGTYEYTATADFPGGLNLRELHKKLKKQAITPTLVGITYHENSNKVIAKWDADLSAAEEALRDTVVSDHALRKAIEDKIKEIDLRTRQMIDGGFEFPPASGLYFSLSANAQRSMTGAMVARNEPEFVYPFAWGTIDEQGEVVLNNATDMRNFYLSGIGHIRYSKSSGRTLKAQAVAATNLAEVAAVVDNR